MGILPNQSIEEVKIAIEKTGQADNLAMIYLETPANPNNALFDMSGLSNEIGDYYQNRNKRSNSSCRQHLHMGPIWQHPLEHDCDLTIYSATKYIGGHSDLIAGAVMGRQRINDKS